MQEVKKEPGTAPKIAQKSTVQLASRASTRLQIHSIRFVDFGAQTTLGSDAEYADATRPLVRFTRPRVVQHADRVEILTQMVFLVAAKPAGAEPPDALVRIHARTELVYLRSGDQDIDTGEMNAFATVNAPFNAWPYWREFVQEALGRLALPTVALPLYRVSDVERFMIPEGSDS